MSGNVISLEMKREARRLQQDSDEQCQKHEEVFMYQHPEYQQDRGLLYALNGLYIILGSSPEFSDKTDLQTLQAAHAELVARMPGRANRPALSLLESSPAEQNQPLTIHFNAGFPRSRYLDALRSAIRSVEGGYLVGDVETEDDVTLKRGDWDKFMEEVAKGGPSVEW